MERGWSDARRLSTAVRGSGTSQDALALPESVVEAVARIATAAAAQRNGPIAAGRTLACIFQVCSTWRNISRSEFLWESLFRSVWAPQVRQSTSSSWQEEYIRVHITASNFQSGRARHFVLEYDTSGSSGSGSGSGSGSSSSSNSTNGIACRCLAISKNHLGGGFFDGTVRIFDLQTQTCIQSMRSGRQDKFGPFSRAIAGIVFQGNQVVFAASDGSIYVGDVTRGQHRSVYVGNVIEDGALISFAGSSRWWVGMYAGSPGRSFRVWDAETKETVYNGGDMMNADAMRGWHSFVEQAGLIGRVRISTDNMLLVAATRLKISVYDLQAHGLPLVTETVERNAVEAVDVMDDKLLSANYDGNARVRRLSSMEDISGFRHAATTRDDQMHLFGTLNSRQLCLCISGTVNAWDVSSGEYLYALAEQLGDDVHDLVASDSFIAACASDTGLHVWDFTPP